MSAAAASLGSVAWASVALSANLPLQPFNSRRVRGEATAVFTPRTRPAVSGPAELPLCPAYFQPFRSRSPCVKCHISTFLLGYQSYSLSTALLNSRSLFSIAVSQIQPLGKALPSPRFCFFFYPQSPDIWSGSSLAGGASGFHLTRQLGRPGELHRGS